MLLAKEYTRKNLPPIKDKFHLFTLSCNSKNAINRAFALDVDRVEIDADVIAINGSMI